MHDYNYIEWPLFVKNIILPLAKKADLFLSAKLDKILQIINNSPGGRTHIILNT